MLRMNKNQLDAIIQKCNSEEMTSWKTQENEMLVQNLKNNYYYSSQNDTMSKPLVLEIDIIREWDDNPTNIFPKM